MVATGRSSRADYLVEAPDSVATLTVTQEATPNPISTLTQGGAILPDGYETRYGGSQSSSTLKFDLGAVPAGCQITSATFQFTVALAIASLEAPSFDVTAFASNGPNASLNDFWTTITSLVGSSPIANGATDLTFQFDVTGLLRSFAGESASEVGFLLSVPTDSNVLIYGNDPANRAGFRPSLAITYAATVPEPPSLALCGIAGAVGLGVGLIRRGARQG